MLPVISLVAEGPKRYLLLVAFSRDVW